MEDFDFQDLTAEEQLAALALLKLLITGDGVVSSGEVAGLQIFAEHIGRDTYNALAERLAEKKLNEAGVRELAKQVLRKDAQELIYAELFDIATDGGIDYKESALLHWLEQTWRLQIKTIADE